MLLVKEVQRIHALQKLLRDGSVISLKLCSTSFISFFSKHLRKKKISTLKYIFTLVNVYMALPVFKPVAGTSYVYFME